MRRHHRFALLIATLALPAAVSAVVYEGFLSGPAAAPPNASPGIGTTTIRVDEPAGTLQLDVSFSGLSGNTTAAHIHCCVAPNGSAGVATQTPSFVGFPLGVTAGSYVQSFDLSLASSFNSAFITGNGGTPATAAVVLKTGLSNGQAYLNIHSSIFPGGEIRSFLTPRDIFGNGFESP